MQTIEEVVSLIDKTRVENFNRVNQLRKQRPRDEAAIDIHYGVVLTLTQILSKIELTNKE